MLIVFVGITLLVGGRSPAGRLHAICGNAGQMRIEGRVAKQMLDGGIEGDAFTISEDGNSIPYRWGSNTLTFYRR
jgi:hypothetical protein